MHVPRYWEKETVTATHPGGHHVEAGCWGWSEQSPEEARSRARAAAKRLTEWLIGDGEVHHYGYDERLPREEIVDEFTDDSGDIQAIVTRNAYGCLILNTRDLMFIDVDFPAARPKLSLPGFLKKLLGQAPPISAEDSVGEKIRAAARDHRELGFRIYRTANGFRVMVVNRPIQAESDESNRLLDAFNADPLYRRMCKNQACFRARLTPKAWRCDLTSPSARFPFADSAEESAQRKWEQKYLSVIAKYSTCQYIETIGNDVPDPSLLGLIELHDKLSKATVSSPLA